jgi:hypothetical protein
LKESGVTMRIFVLLVLGVCLAAQFSVLGLATTSISFSSEQLADLKATFRSVVQTIMTSPDSHLRFGSEIPIIQAATEQKYINFASYSDSQCHTLSSEQHYLLNTCIPDFVSITRGRYLRWSCNSSGTSCKLYGYMDNRCQIPVGHRSIEGAVPVHGECVEDAVQASLRYSLSPTMTVQEPGIQIETYMASSCAVKAGVFYIPSKDCKLSLCSEGLVDNLKCVTLEDKPDQNGPCDRPFLSDDVSTVTETQFHARAACFV